ncbi:putative aquaporin protein [Eutypa lata UCREL1]|uniref:Putative aquaporin protein n=1 Tax=Eutypa lata (strain UCR-EL1) TaxID=1287681 RepID=M7SUH6_EUTLA|nr:putative aquaporin protein [Eutypa lata UCREL1]
MVPSDKPVDRRPRQDRRRRCAQDMQHLSEMQAHFVAATGEFVGTFMFLFFAYATQLMVLDQTSSVAPPAMETVYVSLGYGFSLLVTVWAFYRISGGLFNPAVVLGMCLSGQLPWMRAAFLVPTQIISCMAAGGVVKAMFPGDMESLNTTLAPGMNIAQGLFAEMFFTSYLVFVVLMLAAEKSKDTFIAPVGIGLALFVAELPGVYFTGGSLNPVRSFGCAVAALSFPKYHWIYWLGPALGAFVGAGYFRFVKMCHYEEANPGQDESEPEPEPEQNV